MGEDKFSEGTSAEAAFQIHVLAVDDCLIDRKVIERLLKTTFFKVTAVESAAKALEVLGIDDTQSCNDIKVNMILTDYCMPEMNGYDLLKKIKETQGLKEIPVVMMSSEDVPQRVKRCLAEGAEDFIIKPVQIGDIKKLRNHIKPPKSLSSGSSKRKSYTVSRQGTTKNKTYRHRRSLKSFRKRKVSTGIIAEKSSDERCHLNGGVVA